MTMLPSQRRRRRDKEKARQRAARNRPENVVVIRPAPEELDDQADWLEELQTALESETTLKSPAAGTILAQNVCGLIRSRDRVGARIATGKTKKGDYEAYKGNCSELRRSLEDMGLLIHEDPDAAEDFSAI